MLHAAAMLTGLFVVWLLLTQRWSSPVDIGAAVGASVACWMFAFRFGGGGAGYAQAPALVFASVARAGAVARGVARTLRAALAADITLKPGLVRIRTRAQTAEARAALANMLSAEPGVTAVETDGEGLLAHVIDEDSVDAADMGEIEARLLAATGEVRP